MRARLALLAAVAGVAVSITPAGATTSHTYTAPFTVGPTGGDAWSIHQANSSGTVTVARVYPIPGVINCVKGGPYARLLVTVRARHPVRRIVASYDSAAFDPFTFLTVGLHDGKRWYGSASVRGFVAGTGTVTLVPDRQRGPFPRRLTVEFGLQQSSACPNADEGTVHFSRLVVTQ